MVGASMNSKNRAILSDRVVRAAEASLAAQDYVAPIDVLLGIGWLAPSSVKEWRQGRLDCLERKVQAKLSRISEAMHLLRSWAMEKGLQPSETHYIARTLARQALRFSRSGEPSAERQYCTHWVSPALSEKKRERLAEKGSRAPELVVIQPLNHEWRCHRCGGTGNLLMMENPGPACLRCAGLDDLEFLPAGDASLTRQAKSKSPRFAVVVKFSRTRRHYERQGLLVDAKILENIKRALHRSPHTGARW
jgi:hypothetical protein